MNNTEVFNNKLKVLFSNILQPMKYFLPSIVNSF